MWWSSSLTWSCYQNRCVLLGVSSGANIADYVARKSVEAGKLLDPVKVVAQVLMYPFFIGNTPTRSEVKLANSYFYDKSMCKLAWKLFLPEEEFDLDHPAANPLLRGRQPPLKYMPPSLIVVAENDFMRDRAIAYSEELRKVNVDAPLLDYKDAVHEFATLDVLLHTPQAKACAEDISIWVKKYVSLRGNEFSYWMNWKRRNRSFIGVEAVLPLCHLRWWREGAFLYICWGHSFQPSFPLVNIYVRNSFLSCKVYSICQRLEFSGIIDACFLLKYTKNILCSTLHFIVYTFWIIHIEINKRYAILMCSIWSFKASPSNSATFYMSSLICLWGCICYLAGVKPVFYAILKTENKIVYPAQISQEQSISNL